MQSYRDLLFKGYVDASEVRESWVRERLLEIPEGETIIDCGAGEQKYRKFCAHLNYTSQDVCQYEQSTEGLDMNDIWDTSSIDIVSDIISIPVMDCTFDNVLCTEVLEHIPHPELAIKEFSRILKKNGELVLSAPFHSWTHMAPYHYCTGFNKYWYKTVLEENGFEIVRMDSNGDYFGSLAEDIRRVPYVASTYLTKMGLASRGFIFVMVRMLIKLSKKSNKSNEFGCNGFLVVAKRK